MERKLGPVTEPDLSGSTFQPENFPHLQLLGKIRSKQMRRQAGQAEWVPRYPESKPFIRGSEKKQERVPDVNNVEDIVPSVLDSPEIMLNMKLFQLTEGCNGTCSGICFYGNSGGISAQFSFASVTKFLGEYASYKERNQDYNFPPRILMYGNSDPFSYEDPTDATGPKSFVDVYKEIEKNRRAHSDQRSDTEYISTSLPPGSEVHFLDFMNYAMDQYSQAQQNSERFPATIRLSVLQSNSLLTEGVMLTLTQELLARGYSQEEINAFYQDHVYIGERYNSGTAYEMVEGVPINPIALKTAKPGKEDIITENEKFMSCHDSDGVRVSPIGVFIRASVIPTKYDPFGTYEKKITSAEDVIPVSQTTDYYINQRNKNVAIREKLHFLPPVTRYVSGDSVQPVLGEALIEDPQLILGREMLAYAIAVENFASLDRPIRPDEFGTYDPNVKRTYVDDLMRTYPQRREFTIKQCEKIKASLGDLPPGEREKIQYYLDYTKRWLSMMDRIDAAVKAKNTLEEIAASAREWNSKTERSIMTTRV